MRRCALRRCSHPVVAALRARADAVGATSGGPGAHGSLSLAFATAASLLSEGSAVPPPVAVAMAAEAPRPTLDASVAEAVDSLSTVEGALCAGLHGGTAADLSAPLGSAAAALLAAAVPDTEHSPATAVALRAVLGCAAAPVLMGCRPGLIGHGAAASDAAAVLYDTCTLLKLTSDAAKAGAAADVEETTIAAMDATDAALGGPGCGLGRLLRRDAAVCLATAAHPATVAAALLNVALHADAAALLCDGPCGVPPAFQSHALALASRTAARIRQPLPKAAGGGNPSVSSFLAAHVDPAVPDLLLRAADDCFGPPLPPDGVPARAAMPWQSPRALLPSGTVPRAHASGDTSAMLRASLPDSALWRAAEAAAFDPAAAHLPRVQRPASAAIAAVRALSDGDAAGSAWAVGWAAQAAHDTRGAAAALRLSQATQAPLPATPARLPTVPLESPISPYVGAAGQRARAAALLRTVSSAAQLSLAETEWTPGGGGAVVPTVLRPGAATPIGRLSAVVGGLDAAVVAAHAALWSAVRSLAALVEEPAPPQPRSAVRDFFQAPLSREAPLAPPVRPGLTPRTTRLRGVTQRVTGSVAEITALLEQLRVSDPRLGWLQAAAADLAATKPFMKPTDPRYSAILPAVSAPQPTGPAAEYAALVARARVPGAVARPGPVTAEPSPPAVAPPPGVVDC